MSQEGYTCEECGVFVPPGGWPFCKGGHGNGRDFYASKFEEFVSKHMDTKPVRITSWRQFDREMKKRGLAHLSDFAPTDAERKHVEWAREERARRRSG